MYSVESFIISIFPASKKRQITKLIKILENIAFQNNHSFGI